MLVYAVLVPRQASSEQRSSLFVSQPCSVSSRCHHHVSSSSCCCFCFCQCQSVHVWGGLHLASLHGWGRAFFSGSLSSPRCRCSRDDRRDVALEQLCGACFHPQQACTTGQQRARASSRHSALHARPPRQTQLQPLHVLLLAHSHLLRHLINHLLVKRKKKN